MATQKQIEANRKNAQLSTGPVTPRGKQRSRANSYRHGMAGDGVVLPEEDVAIVAERVAVFAAESPKDDATARLIDLICADSVRVDRCYMHEHALLVNQAERARELWDEDRTNEAERLFEQLPKTPRLAREMELTPQGCALKVDCWQGLLRALKARGTPWDEGERSLAFDLIALPHILRNYATPIDVPPWEQGDTVAHQTRLATSEIARIENVSTNRCGVYDKALRERTEKGLAFPGRDVWLVRRYEMAIQRRQVTNLKSLIERRNVAPVTASTSKPATSPDSSFRPAPAPPPKVMMKADVLLSDVAPASCLKDVVASPPAEPPDLTPISVEVVEVTPPPIAFVKVSATADGMTPRTRPLAVKLPVDVAVAATLAPAPAPVKGNRRHRRAMARLARERTG